MSSPGKPEGFFMILMGIEWRFYGDLMGF